MNSLIIRFEPDHSDGVGRLTVAANTPDFSGEGYFWVQWQDVEEFASLLDTYPIQASAPPSARWGYNDLVGDDVIIAIQIRPFDSLGTLLVDVKIADLNEPSRGVRTSFRTHYPDLERFQRAIARMTNGETDEAVLVGS